MNFGVLIFPQAEELDIVGPWEMLTMWAKHAQGPEHCLMVAQSLEPVICAKGMEITPHASFETCPALNYLLIPGGQGTRTEVNNRQLVDFIAQQAASCQAILSVCTGSFLLHAAGLLTGRMATTHWGSLQRMRALGDVNVVEERFVRDGNIWSSAGCRLVLTSCWRSLLASRLKKLREECSSLLSIIRPGSSMVASKNMQMHLRTCGPPDCSVQRTRCARR